MLDMKNLKLFNPNKSLASTLMALSILVLSNVSMSLAQNVGALPGVSQTQHKPLVVLISIDGYRNDYMSRGLTPTLKRLADSGAYAENFMPVFPSITFPNHYSLVTGLYPDHHGLVNNTMQDPTKTKQIFKLSDRESVTNPIWYEEATPIWISAKQQGKIVSTLFWPGTEVINHGLRPDDWLNYDDNMASDKRVDQLLEWLNRDESKRADFASLYFSEVDHAGHEFGPDASEVNESLKRVDIAIDRFVKGLERLNLLKDVTFVITSDHGMAHVTQEHVINLSTVLENTKSAKLVWMGPVAGFNVDRVDAEPMLERLKTYPHMSCWHKSKIPPEYHFGTHRRIPDIFCLADVGWSILPNSSMKVIAGMHGYDARAKEMQGLFIAAGPGVKKQTLPVVHNIDVYVFLAHLLKIKPEPNDGEDSLFKQIMN